MILSGEGVACRRASLPRKAVARPISTLAPALRVRGGAGKSAAESRPEGPPPLSASFVAKVLGFAVLPTLSKVAYDAASGDVLTLPEGWQVAIAVAWSANMISVAAPGRYDGQSSAERAKEAEEATALTANLFAPTGWAFAIWSVT